MDESREVGLTRLASNKSLLDTSGISEILSDNLSVTWLHREPVIFDVAVHAGWVNLSVMRFHVPKLTTTGMLLVLVANVAAQQPTRRGWKNINAEGLFMFRLPVGFRQSEMGIDTYMRGYQRGRARFIFVCGDSASDEYDEKTMRHAREVPLSVDGKQATVRTFVYKLKRTSVYVTELNVGAWRDGRVELYMGMESPNRADIQTAKRIFRSVGFLKPGCV